MRIKLLERTQHVSCVLHLPSGAGCTVCVSAVKCMNLGQASSPPVLLRVKIEVYNCLNGQFYSGPLARLR